MYTLRIYLRKRKTGTPIIYFIVKDQWISTDIKCEVSDWNAEHSVILKSHPEYHKVSPDLSLLKARAENCINLLALEAQPFSKQFFSEFIFKGKEAAENPCFIELIQQYTDSEDLSWARVKHYKEFKNDIKAVIQRPKLHDINYKFALRLKQYLKTKENNPNNDNTITRKMKQLKAVIHYCMKTGLLKSDPLAILKLKEIRGNKKHLSILELEQLENLYQEKKLQDNYQTALQYFLFSCYTGLRFSDITRLNISHLNNNSIQINQQKTNKPVFVPLIEKALNLIQPDERGNLFKTYCNQPTNRYLKEIMSIALIDKNITYHCSRHTFGTLSIYWGISKEVVADIMGVDMKTVNIYAKIIEDVKIREMQKWGRIAI